MPANRCGGCDITIHAASGFYGVAGPGVVTIATVYDVEANARLIASAPELLAALESIAAIVPDVMSKQAEDGFRYHTAEDAYRVHLAGLINQARTQARAAIARATGGNAS